MKFLIKAPASEEIGILEKLGFDRNAEKTIRLCRGDMDQALNLLLEADYEVEIEDEFEYEVEVEFEDEDEFEYENGEELCTKARNEVEDQGEECSSASIMDASVIGEFKWLGAREKEADLNFGG